MKRTTKDIKEKEEKIKRIAAISKKIRYHQELYYNKNPEITDEEFDALWDRLRELDVDNELFKGVGKDFTGFFSKTNHIMPMGSLDKAANEEQFSAWIKDHPSDDYMVQYKLDGASLELQYQEGKLVAAVTRGNGVKGDNIIINARKMKGVNLNLKEALSFAVRGEVMMTHTVHKEHFPEKANCRNAANGLMKRKDGVKVQFLKFFCYDVWFEQGDHTPKKYAHITEPQKLALLQKLGFEVVPHQILHKEEAINTYRNKVLEIRDSLDFDIDGLVIKMPQSDDDDMKTLRPSRQIAYKFPLEHAQTKIVAIEWSRSGYLYTPVGIVEPVKVAGTMVKRANLVHINHMKELGIGIGAEVLIVKRGEIIPKIEKVVIDPEHLYDFVPLTCEVCGSTIENTGTRVFCPNLECMKRVLFRVSRWCSLLDLDYWGESLLQKLVLETNLVKRIGDLYRLDYEKLSSLERMGDQIIKKLLTILHERKKIPFSLMLASLAIDGVALVTAEKIVAAGIRNWDSLCKKTEEELALIGEIGPIISKNIVQASMLLHEEVRDIESIMTVKEEELDEHAVFYQESFCFTGTLSNSRSEMELLVKKHGGIVKKSVGKDLSYLVTNDLHSSSEKTKKAYALSESGHKIKIITEDEFLARIPK